MTAECTLHLTPRVQDVTSLNAQLVELADCASPDLETVRGPT